MLQNANFEWQFFHTATRGVFFFIRSYSVIDALYEYNYKYYILGRQGDYHI